jgi:hypothetical protein
MSDRGRNPEGRRVQSSVATPTTEVLTMCHDWWMRRERQREERFDEELRYLLDERESSERPTPVVEHDRDEPPAEPERVEAGIRA